MIPGGFDATGLDTLDKLLAEVLGRGEDVKCV
jgi:hypothetical protein